MDQCTHEIRAEYWKGIIKACTQRPAGQSVKNWLDENGVCEQSYYYWQRKFRQQAYGLVKGNAPAVPEASREPSISFIEIPYQPPVPADTQPCGLPCVAVIKTPSIRIEVTNDISDAVLARIWKPLYMIVRRLSGINNITDFFSNAKISNRVFNVDYLPYTLSLCLFLVCT